MGRDGGLEEVAVTGVCSVLCCLFKGVGVI